MENGDVERDADGVWHIRWGKETFDCTNEVDARRLRQAFIDNSTKFRNLGWEGFKKDFAQNEPEMFRQYVANFDKHLRMAIERSKQLRESLLAANG